QLIINKKTTKKRKFNVSNAESFNEKIEFGIDSNNFQKLSRTKQQIFFFAIVGYFAVIISLRDYNGK
ncbi:hypothetical protein P9477_22505, partial [Enterobacter mori]|uniref:hypothetical protein n=1 Tax=Enterobacter mori TaxID=539813 RepID=UPI00398B4999